MIGLTKTTDTSNVHDKNSDEVDDIQQIVATDNNKANTSTFFSNKKKTSSKNINAADNKNQIPEINQNSK